MSLSNLVLFWNEKATELLDFHSNPGHDSRRFAVVQIAIHDTLNCYKKKYRKYSSETSNSGMNLPNKYWESSPEEAVNSAASEVLKWAVQDIIQYTNNVNYTLAQIAVIDNWYLSKKTIDDPKAVQVGKFWANQIISTRNNDNIHLVKIVSPFPNGTLPRKFRGDYYTFPLPEDKFMVNYSVVKPFVLNKHDQFRRDLNYTASEQTNMIEEVELMGSKQYVDTLPVKKKDKIEYWSDIKQHILWNNFARQIITSKNLDAWKIARVFALIHTAMADGAIAMFGDLYHFYHWRPATAINLKHNGNPISDPKWIPYKGYDQTPRVPEYPSSFGVFGGAAGEILEAIFPGRKNAISGAVNDNALTKIYCGWNFKKSANESVKLGRDIGRYILKHKLQRSRVVGPPVPVRPEV